MTAKEILAEIKPLGQDGYKRILLNHGIQEPCWGVKIEHLKKIQKRIKQNYQLALDLYDTGIYDAMYLAGLIADDGQMTKKDLQKWATHPNAGPLTGSIIPWVSAGSRYGWELAREWIDSPKETLAAAGWRTLGSLVAIKPDTDLDIAELKRLLQRVQKTIQQQPDDVRYAMNGFVIALGGYVKELTTTALTAGEKIGKVTVDMGNTACQVPYAPDYIRKIENRGAIGKKRKSAKC